LIDRAGPVEAGAYLIEWVDVAEGKGLGLAQKKSGENDAWLVATAESIDADIVGADRIAFERLGARYLRYR
jgi:hypothetical protein